jgi:hypothetical protein
LCALSVEKEGMNWGAGSRLMNIAKKTRMQPSVMEFVPNVPVFIILGNMKLY